MERHSPPRPGGRRVHFWSGGGQIHNVDVNCSGRGTRFEVVVNEGGSAVYRGTAWDYIGTVSPAGGTPFPIVGQPGMGKGRTPPKVSTTGRIFLNATPGGNEGRSTAGTPRSRGGRGGPGGNLNPSRPKKRSGFVSRIVGPSPGVKLPKSSTSRTPNANPQGGSYPGQVPKILFSGKGNTRMTTYIRRIPSRSVRRIVLRGGRPY